MNGSDDGNRGGFTTALPTLTSCPCRVRFTFVCNEGRGLVGRFITIQKLWVNDSGFYDLAINEIAVHVAGAHGNAEKISSQLEALTV